MRCTARTTACGTAFCRAWGRAWSMACAPGPAPARAWPPLQSEQAAAGPVRPRDRRPLALDDRAPWLRDGPPGRHAFAGPARQRRACAEGPRGAATANGAGPAECAARGQCRPRAVRVHVKGFTMQHPGIPEALRGTYAGLAHPAAIAHFKRLGVTTLSLLPVHYHLDEPHLATRGASTTGATTRWASSRPIRVMRSSPHHAVAEEFRHMVATLHQHGLEVVLDVVYNHTAEGGETGPTISFRGLDHASWYRLVPGDPGAAKTSPAAATPCMSRILGWRSSCWIRCATGCRRWASSGFRFRSGAGAGPHPPWLRSACGVFTALKQDPLLSSVHLIAEPWDAAADGYQVGRFPGRWLEWTTSSATPCAATGWAAPMAWARAAASLRGASPPAPTCSTTASAGPRPASTSSRCTTAFTLADVTSYSSCKHNQANGEDNRDGRNDEPAAHFGIEGETDDAAILALRGRAPVPCWPR